MEIALSYFAHMINGARLLKPELPLQSRITSLIERVKRVGGPIPTRPEKFKVLLIALRDEDPDAWRNFIKTLLWDETSGIDQDVVDEFLRLAPESVRNENLRPDFSTVSQIKEENEREWRQTQENGSGIGTRRRLTVVSTVMSEEENHEDLFVSFMRHLGARIEHH